MDGSYPIDASIARNHAARTGQEGFVPVGSGNILPGDQWFMHIAHGLWGDNKAKMVRFLTGFPERTCRSAAHGHTDPSGPLIYALLRGDHGQPFYGAIMHGCEQPWFTEQQRAIDVGRKVLDLTR